MTNNDQLDRLGDLVNEIGDQIMGTTKLGDSETEALICRHGNNIYMIYKEPNHDYYYITYQFEIMSQIGQVLSEESINEILDDGEEIASDEIDVTEDDFHAVQIDMEEDIAEETSVDLRAERATIKLLKSIDSDLMERFQFQLFQQISDPLLESNITHTEGGIFTGFSISRKIFPEDEGFSLTEFNTSVQAVMAKGVFGSNIVGRLIGFQDEGGEIEEVTLDDPSELS